VFAERYFGFRLGRRQWVGVTITAAGLAVIGLTGGGATRPPRASLAALIAVEGAIFATGAALVRISTRRHLLDRDEGLLLGAAAGALFGVSDVAIKDLTQAPPGPHRQRPAPPAPAPRATHWRSQILRSRVAAVVIAN
jgi:drug/metabolite transporter (DMT)-like permease